MPAPDQQAPDAPDDGREMGYLHTSASDRRARTEAEDAAPTILPRRGVWVWVTFRGFDKKSAIRSPGWLNLATVRALEWDEGEQVTLVEFVGQGADADGRRVTERPDQILGTEG